MKPLFHSSHLFLAFGYEISLLCWSIIFGVLIVALDVCRYEGVIGGRGQ